MCNERIARLAEEVVSLFCSERLFQPDVEYESRQFELANGSETLTIRVCTILDYLNDIYLHNESSHCKALGDWFREIETWAATLRQFDTIRSYKGIEASFDEITAAIENSSRVDAFVTRLLDIGDSRYSREDFLENVTGGIVSAAQHIIDARVVFLGKRFGLTEAVFAAYGDGLFPFGYDRVETELLCVRPCVAVQRQSNEQM